MMQHDGAATRQTGGDVGDHVLDDGLEDKHNVLKHHQERQLGHEHLNDADEPS